MTNSKKKIKMRSAAVLSGILLVTAALAGAVLIWARISGTYVQPGIRLTVLACLSFGLFFWRAANNLKSELRYRTESSKMKTR